MKNNEKDMASFHAIASIATNQTLDISFTRFVSNRRSSRCYYPKPTRRSLLIILFLMFCVLNTLLYARAEEVVIVNPDVTLESLSKNALRAIFGMRLRTWPDNQPIKVFVFTDDNPIHASFAKSQLLIFPQQLRRAWDRLIYSGTGQGPNQVKSVEEMRNAIATTPGAIGYIQADQVTDRIRVLEVE